MRQEKDVEKELSCVSGLCESSCQTEGAIRCAALLSSRKRECDGACRLDFPHNCYIFTRACQYHYRLTDDRSKSSLETYVIPSTLGERLKIGLGILSCNSNRVVGWEGEIGSLAV
jgi:hypothetical protein